MRVEQWFDLARETLDGLVACARPAPGGIGWLHTDAVGRTADDPWLYEGSAGVALVLVLGFEATGDARYLDAAVRAARALAGRAPGARGAHPGLYIGEAGIGALFLRLGRATGDARWLSRATERARWAAAEPPRWIELFYGAAGIGLFLVDLFRATGDPGWLGAAEEQAMYMERTARGPPEAPWWEIEPGARRRAGCGWPGLAHGSAGIALFLEELAAALGAGRGDRWHDLAGRAARWIGGVAVRAGPHVAWPRIVPGDPTDIPVQWCHGAPGIGLFAIRAHALTGRPEVLDLARRAAEATAAAGDARSNPCLCHGLAGNADLLVEMGRVTGDAAYHEQARHFLSDLPRYAVRREGRLAWSSDDPGVVRPALATGSAGVAYILLRLAAAGRIGLPFLAPGETFRAPGPVAGPSGGARA